MSAQAHFRITRLATQLAVHRAFQWLHLHQPQLRAWQMEMLAIPAPPFGEGERAAWFADKFRELGLADVGVDAEGNALGSLGDSSARKSVLLSAHLDTVFPAGTDTVPREEEIGGPILGPGACDNAAGLTALLAIAAAMRHAGIVTAAPVLFAANVGEEGEGDLRGMRFLFERGVHRGRIGAAIALEGAGTSAVVTRALGSRRYRVTICGPGGHSWTDAGTPNPITLLSRGLAELGDLIFPDEPRTVLSPGQIFGGTSINSIPSEASVLLDLRSTDPAQMLAVEREIHRTFENVVARATGSRLKIEMIGNRPAGELAMDSAMLRTIRAVDRHLGFRTELRIGSTDANLPLSLGVPAVAMAAGGTGGGIHTLGEWYDPAGREMALRRVLLTVLDLAGD
ncbi:M20/M25/M40 family metallo-hydrolase [Granulicella sp. WH15]|uniref:M20/M25/M40 family metallo-hydrolase n=1 Tax=Granulicella sp. WH15 TaxID=2602070 RepID=UPI00136734A4|nr:M20/M25/M40 family metallo-hydrolase [Granulicella sp. WH15]QHN03905.1 M20/M25/M40 family metallo-hydrolase [Granulicella sp. WH15]